jgi:hypothetical protein
LRVLPLEEDFGEPAMRLTTWNHAGNGKIQSPHVDIAKNHSDGASSMRSGRDLLDENPALGRAELDVEVEQEAHPEHAIDTVSKLGHVDVHGGVR